MKVVGSVSPDEVPQTGKATFGVWTGLADQAVAEHKKGRVLTVKVADRDEYRKMANGIADRIRQAGYSRQVTVIEEPDGLLVYLQLLDGTRVRGQITVAPPLPPRRRAKAS